MAEPRIWYILQKREYTAQLSKLPGKPQKTTEVDNGRFISMIKKNNNFTTSIHVKNNVDVPLSKSTI